MSEERIMTYEELTKKIKSLPRGTIIPKPQAEKNFTIKGIGKRRNEEALIYIIPTNNPEKYPKGHEKGITFNEFYSSYAILQETSKFERAWIETNLPECIKEGSCNFTTIGGIFELLGIAQYNNLGCYILKKKQ